MLQEKIEQCNRTLPRISELLIKNDETAIMLLQENYGLITETLLQLLDETEKKEIEGLSSELVLNEIKVFIDAFQNADVIMLADCIGYEIEALLNKALELF